MAHAGAAPAGVRPAPSGRTAPRAVVVAAAQAERAADWIQGRRYERAETAQPDALALAA